LSLKPSYTRQNNTIKQIYRHKQGCQFGFSTQT
jgi:hypothetical protein